MNELLFKLKKDGKCVGYERYVYCDQREGYVKGKSLVPQHSKDGIHWEHIYSWDMKTTPKGYYFESYLDTDVYIEHDEKCHFVTTDKNGDKVFADDGVIWDEDYSGTVIYAPDLCCWLVEIDIEGKPSQRIITDNIELIKEQS
ncbi:MAG: hypothetical protein V3U75_04130 [Methylococcaceae bacterium]